MCLLTLFKTQSKFVPYHKILCTKGMVLTSKIYSGMKATKTFFSYLNEIQEKHHWKYAEYFTGLVIHCGSRTVRVQHAGVSIEMEGNMIIIKRNICYNINNEAHSLNVDGI